MKKLLTLAFALISLGATAQNLTFEVQANEAKISLTGATEMTALQFNLKLPKGVSVDTNNATLGSATDGHTLCIETLDNGDLLFILYSMDLNTFMDGELLRLPINGKRFDTLCEGFGMSASTAFNIFVRTVVRQRRIPFTIEMPEEDDFC